MGISMTKKLVIVLASCLGVAPAFAVQTVDAALAKAIDQLRRGRPE